MKFTRTSGLISSALALAALFPGVAHAHHAMGGKLPSTFSQGFLSGLGHPVIGMDHLAFTIGVGLLAAFIGYRFLLPLVFVAATLLGTGIHMMSLDLPAAEMVIALSVAVAGILVVAQSKLPVALLAGGFAAAGLFHGYAYGESIVGAETTVVGAYLLGFSVIQYAIAVGAGQVFAMLADKDGTMATSYAKVAGGAMAGVALMILSEMAFAL